MRKWIACLIGFGVALAASAAQADGLYRTNTGPGGADFSGVGLGVDVGAAIGGNSSINTSGIAGGAHVGYNLQNGPIVGGVEADAFIGSISGGASGMGNLTQNWLTSARIKGGYAFGDLLAYGTFGAAWSTTSYESLGYTANKDLHGYVFGIGAEYALTRSVSLRAELRRYNFDGATYYMPTGSQALTSGTNILMLGASTHF
jgi:outer membrane immunogenic protein